MVFFFGLCFLFYTKNKFLVVFVAFYLFILTNYRHDFVLTEKNAIYRYKFFDKKAEKTHKRHRIYEKVNFNDFFFASSLM